MMQAESLMEKSYKRVQGYGKMDDNGKSKRSDETLARIESKRPCVKQDGNTIAVDELVRAVDVGMRSSSTAGYESELAESSKISSMKVCLPLFRELFAEWSKSVSDTKVRQTFLKPGYQMREYFPTILNVYLEKDFIRKPVQYERISWRVFATDRFESSGNKKNCFVLVVGRGEKGSGFLGEKVLHCLG